MREANALFENNLVHTATCSRGRQPAPFLYCCGLSHSGYPVPYGGVTPPGLAVLPWGAGGGAGYCHWPMGAPSCTGRGEHYQWYGFLAPAGHVDRALRPAAV